MFGNVAVGLDIADDSIKVVELRKNVGKFVISAHNHVLLDSGIVQRGRVKDPIKLAKVLSELFVKAKPKAIVKENIIFGLPDAIVYTHAFSIDPQNSKNISAAVAEEIKLNIPEDINDIDYAYSVLSKSKDGISIVATAADKNAVREWYVFFKKNNFNITGFDGEIFAMYRGLLIDKKKEDDIVAVVDIGAASTHIGCFDKTGLLLSVDLNFGGDNFTQALVTALNVTSTKAEDFKTKNGLQSANKKAAVVLIKSADTLSAEIQKSLDYFFQKFNSQVNYLLLVGGGAKLAGLDVYISKKINLPVSVGNPDAIDQSAWEYIEAMGLARRALEKKWAMRDPQIQLSAAEKKIKIPDISPSDSLKTTVAGEDANSIANQLTTNNMGLSKQRGEIALLVILLVGLVGIFGAYGYNLNYKDKILSRMQQYASSYSKEHTFELQVPLALNTSTYAPDRLQGRIIENQVDEDITYDEALQLSKAEAEKNLSSNEAIFGQLLSAASQEAVAPKTPTTSPSTIKRRRPYSFTWIVYNNIDADKLLIKGVTDLNKNKITFFLKNIEKDNFEQTDNMDLVYLKGRVNVLTQDNF